MNNIFSSMLFAFFAMFLWIIPIAVTCADKDIELKVKLNLIKVWFGGFIIATFFIYIMTSVKG